MPYKTDWLQRSLICLLLAFPLGVATAVYLHEYAGNTPFARMVRLGVNNLAGVPSVVFGLFGLSFFVTFCGFGVCILSGILTLAVLTLPVIINTAEEALRAVSVYQRDGHVGGDGDVLRFLREYDGSVVGDGLP